MWPSKKWCSVISRLSLTDFVRTLLEIKTDAYEVVYFITNVVIRKGVIDDFGFVRQATKSLSYNAHSHTSLLGFLNALLKLCASSTIKQSTLSSEIFIPLN